MAARSAARRRWGANSMRKVTACHAEMLLGAGAIAMSNQSVLTKRVLRFGGGKAAPSTSANASQPTPFGGE